LFYLNATIDAAVEDADTAVIIPGINPLADTNVNTDWSYVLSTKLPICPTYNPPATNPNCGALAEADANAEPEIGVTAVPPTNCGLVIYEF
jgi:hypothetical protein